VDLSQDDIRGLRLLYPHIGPADEAMLRQRRALLAAIDGSNPGASQGLEGDSSSTASVFAQQASQILRRNLSQWPK
jgi:hypothetical protein